MKLLNPVALEIKTQFENNEALCQKVIGIFQLAANKTRFRIICTLSKGDFCVNDIAEIIGAERLSNVSQQLKMLRLAGLIESRREKSQVIYSLTDEKVRRMIAFLQEEFLSTEGT
ncbi:MAG: ArsR/SmtB family transcription factor [Opitutaceae bacterium]